MQSISSDQRFHHEDHHAASMYICRSPLHSPDCAGLKTITISWCSGISCQHDSSVAYVLYCQGKQPSLSKTNSDQPKMMWYTEFIACKSDQHASCWSLQVLLRIWGQSAMWSGLVACCVHNLSEDMTAELYDIPQGLVISTSQCGANTWDLWHEHCQIQSQFCCVVICRLQLLNWEKLYS